MKRQGSWNRDSRDERQVAMSARAPKGGKGPLAGMRGVKERVGMRSEAGATEDSRGLLGEKRGMWQ